MKSDLSELYYNHPDLNDIHEMYWEELQSLNRTCDWIGENYPEYAPINRYQLSYAFHKLGYPVKAPNGKAPKQWRETNYFLDAFGDFAQAYFVQLWNDIREKPDKIAWMSACAAFGTEFYERILGTLLRNVEAFTVNRDQLPPGIRKEDIVRGTTLYNQGYRYWVLGLDE